MARYSTNITLKTQTETHAYGKDKEYNEITKIEKEFDSNDTFDNLATFDWDGISSNFRDCKGILICNVGKAAAELQLNYEGWTHHDTGADSNAASDSYNNTFLSAGDCLWLPHNRLVGYDEAASSGGALADQKVAAVDFLTGFVTTGTAVNMGSGTTVGDTTGIDAITVDGTSALQFHPGDYLAIGCQLHSTTTEIVKVVTVDSATQISVKRGELGTTPINHADDSVIYWWFGNSYLPVTSMDSSGLAFVAGGDASTPSTITDSNNGFLTAGFKSGDLIFLDVNGEDNDQETVAVKTVVAGTLTLHINHLLTAEAAGQYKIHSNTTHTDLQGRYAVSNFFGKFRTAAATDVGQGLVPGSVAIQFSNPASWQSGLNNLQSSTETGLTASTAYTFKLNIDGKNSDLTVTTDSSNSLFTGKNGLIEKMNNAINDAVAAGTYQSGAVVSMFNGDLIITSKTAIGQFGGKMADAKGSNYSRGYSQIRVEAADSGTALFGSGRLPSGGFKEIYPHFQDLTVFPNNNRKDGIPNSADLLIDQGDGTLSRQRGGVGTINYNTGAIDFQGCPPKADFRIWGTGGSALSGVMRTDAASTNCIETINARSMNPVANAKLMCVILS